MSLIRTGGPALSDESFDLVIVGGGPAGLTAGIYAARSGLSAVIIDEGMCGGLAATSPWIENYPGFEGISGMDLMQKMKEHAEKNLPINEGVHIDSIEMSDDGFVLKAGDTIIQGSAIILATGAKYR
ncbi:MAG: FAD-dependent oxidoreductase, partial [Thermoplasmata archaeon]|nr:FAD-dependent oxidoreductase [Thermoplasmata archaeon]